MDWTRIIETAIVTLPATLFALASFIQSTRSHTQAVRTEHAVNSKMSEMLVLNTAAATLAEKDAEHVRRGEAAVTAAKTVEEPIRL